MSFATDVEKWEKECDRLFLSCDGAGEKLARAVVESPMTMDEAAEVVAIAADMALRGIRAVDVLRVEILRLRNVGVWVE